ncbi:FAD-dependent monooxygenase [Sinorhizobium meliloti CCNWSX0020]|uniref:FAD-dependent monooxygenase n=1 Tax=Sinorhizobium meliloti CCNWSX0020 TaxID=1107881 RepID=H0FU89_RHIML|nr:FAD-dependent monooxygenase [Sinorhizobium meliloti]EHK79420.1 FAD-dependent monooxygenase [Sinorhizobium meliloti CCNWSX0020]
MKDVYDCIVVGGGPVGLWLSCELRLAGLRVVVIERRTQRINQSRALTIHGRTLEVLSLRGIEERFLAVGKPVRSGHYAVLDTRLDFDIFDSRFPYTLFIPQETTEALIEEFALELGVEILRGAMAERIVSESDGVTVFGTNDRPFELSGRYVVGADGARSLVRSETGIEFEGHSGNGAWLLGDVVLASPPDTPLVSAFNEHGCVLVAPLGDGAHYRIVVNEADDRGRTRQDTVTLEELRQATARILGSDFGAHSPLWLSRFDNETRLAKTYRRGNIFLAGDAAHIHLPAGGQGMNVGIQDAMNLGWKLAAVAKGTAPVELLDTYESERLPVGIYLRDTTMAQSHLITAFSARGRALRGVFNDMLKVPTINAYFANQVSGFAVHYPDPLPGFGAGRSTLVGGRIRDTPLRLSDGTDATLFGLLSKGQWLDLTISEGTKAERPDWLHPHSVVEARGIPTDHADTLGNIGALLVRPDGYVAQTAVGSSRREA